MKTLSTPGVVRIEFWVDGEPKAQARPRAFVRRTPAGPVARVYDSGSAEGWKSLIAMAARPHRPAAPIETPVSVCLAFEMPRPKRLCRERDPEIVPHASRPDCDNLAKSFLDCMTSLGFWRDDAIVCDLVITKQYARKTGGRPGLHVLITYDEVAE